MDNEPTAGNTIEMVLDAEGHQVETVSIGEQALEKIGKRNYDIVFTDP